MKKLMVAVAALLCSAAMLFAQTSEVKTATSDLIEDGAIDSLAFGIEDNEGLTFVQFNGGADYINFGTGKWLGDSFWLSVYDSWSKYGSLYNNANVRKTYGTKDDINIDYTDTHKWNNVSNTLYLNNTFGLGLGFGSFGTQLVWTANWDQSRVASKITSSDNIFNASYADAGTISDETENTPAGTKETTKYDKIKNYTRNNTFKINFDGAGAKDLGDNEFYVQLNNISCVWNNTTRANTYDYVKNVNEKDLTHNTAEAAQIDNSFTPGLEFELGFNIAEKDNFTTKLVFVDNFSMGLNANKANKTYTTVDDSLTQTKTEKYEYQIIDGKYLDISNTLTPKFIFDFDIDEKLQLVAQISAAISTGKTSNAADTFKKVKTTTTVDKSTGDVSIQKDTSTGTYNGNTDSDNFSVGVTPSYALGLVYQLNPGKMNLNFGVNVNRSSYNWGISKTTNSNINNVTVNETTDRYGNTTGSKTVNVQTGGDETKTISYTSGSTTTSLRLGGTWFFGDNVKLDVYWANDFTTLFSGNNSFGIDLCVLF